MDITQQLKEYLEAAPEERDLAHGNLLLLKLSGNRIGYNMIERCRPKYAAHIERQLRKYYLFRIRGVQHEEVQEMQKKVEKIVEENISLAVATDQAPKAGMREDHASLPEEIQKLYDDNLEILVNMRKLHAKMRSLSLAESPCPDSEVYPFLKELIKLDKKLHANWEKYDTYK